MSEYRNIVVERRNHVYLVRVNRPEVLNSINEETSWELEQAWTIFREDRELWVGVLTGTGDKAFSAGFDLNSISEKGVVATAQAARAPFGGITAGPEIWKPLICAINGVALGGGLEMALVCDLRVASTNAVFALPEVSWGLMAAGGGLVRLPRIIPLPKAMEMILMAKRIKADEALEIGLVNAVVPPAEVLPTALQWADRICEMAPLAVSASKEVTLRSLDLTMQEGLKLDDAIFDVLGMSEDSVEGPKAFAEKRKPIFRAR